MFNRREFLRVAAGASGASILRPAPARKPNFLVILADDMGFSDARCYGGDVDTPNLDRLAAGGLRFTQAYSTARCGPSRSCLLTGQYAQQTASDVMTPGKIPNYVRYIPEYLKPLGYRSYHSGKWHMKYTPQGRRRGLRPLLHHAGRTPVLHAEPSRTRWRALPKPEPRLLQHDRDRRLRSALPAGARTRSTRPIPSFSMPRFHSPHFPLQAPQEDIDKYKDRFSEGWDVARERKWQRMRQMGLINCALAPLEPNMWTKWNTPDEELIAKIGPGEVARAVPWSTLTPEQKKFQRTKMAIHAAMITRMDVEIGKLLEAGGDDGRARRHRGHLPLRQRRQLRTTDTRRRARLLGAGRFRAHSPGDRDRGGRAAPTLRSGCTSPG